MKPIRILIVEDMDTIRKMYDKVLPGEIFEKHFAADGKQGLEVYNAKSPDVLLLDIQMPILNGTELLKIIRNDLGDKRTAIIMQTSRTDKKEIVECAQFGIQGYIVKPFVPLEVGGKILEYYRSIDEERTTQALEIMSRMAQDPQEHEYQEEIRYCLKNGDITETQRRLLDRLREKLGINAERAQELEKGIIDATAAASEPTPEETEYMEELRLSAANGDIGEDARMLLNRHREKLGISEERAKELEKLVLTP